MQDTGLVLFVVTSLVVILAPGPDNILVLTRGITLGRRAALVSAAGASVGLVCHSLFAAAGLSALLARSATAFSVVKYIGAAYLIFLGVRALLDREDFALPRAAGQTRLRSVFAQAVTSNVLNPKIAVFFLAYLPQFVDPAAEHPALWLLTLGLAFALLTLMIFGALALFSGSVGRRLKTRPRLANILGWLTGGVLVGLGLRLALSDLR